MAYRSARDNEEVARLERMAAAIDAGQPPWLAGVLDKVWPAVRIVQHACFVASPYMFTAGEQAVQIYSRLPKQACTSMWGLGVCFFGGRYAVTIAAAEAFRTAGGSQTWQCLQSLADQASLVLAANKEDEQKDSNNDGTPDTQQLRPAELAQRKALLVLRTVDPDVLMTALHGIAAGYVGVLAVLKVRFAQTAAFARSIADSIRPTASKVLGPLVLHSLPPEYRRWSSPLINIGCNVAAGYVAWKVQSLLSTVQCGVAGGLLAARSLMELARQKNVLQCLGEVEMADELFGYSLASCGIYIQLVHGGAPVPFLCKPLLWPLDILERWLQYSVTWGSDQAA